MEADLNFEDIHFPSTGEHVHHDSSESDDSIEANIELGPSSNKESFGDVPTIVVEGEQSDFPQMESGDVIPVVKRMGFDDFQILKTIGQGSYGKVFQVRCKANNKIYAMKVMKKQFLFAENAITSTKAERQVMVTMRHPFIMEMYCALQSPERVGFIMKFINGGQLFFHLRNDVIFDEDKCRYYIAELVVALEHLHNHDIVHRDLKPENILISSEGHIVLTDFGLSKIFDTKEGKTTTACGTYEYMSPEMIKGVKYGKETDWWSVGVLLFDMLNGKPPFRHPNQKELFKLILTKKLTYANYWSAPTVAILKRLLEREAPKRIKIKELKQHKFFTSKFSFEQIQSMSIPPPFIPPVKDEHDLSHIDTIYTEIKKNDFSPVSPLTSSQNDLFNGFSYARSFSPAPTPLHLSSSSNVLSDSK